jgi:hypothetical protein
MDFFQVKSFLGEKDELVDFDVSTRWKLWQEVNQKVFPSNQNKNKKRISLWDREY